MPERLRISKQQEVSCVEGEVREHRHLYALRPLVDDAVAKTGHRSEHDVARAAGEMGQAEQQAAHGNRSGDHRKSQVESWVELSCFASQR